MPGANIRKVLEMCRSEQPTFSAALDLMAMAISVSDGDAPTAEIGAMDVRMLGTALGGVPS
jgi:hypothetical protein